MSSSFPPGFCFYPTEEELLGFYLHSKLENERTDDIERVIPVVDVYGVDPWQLQERAGDACKRNGCEQWFFFCPMQEREAQGGRPSRTTPSGYWKATGSPSLVYSAATNRPIGQKKTMVFYRGRAPLGAKTKWKMNDYRALDDQEQDVAILSPSPKLRREFSLCRVYTKCGGLRLFDRRPCMASNSEPSGSQRSFFTAMRIRSSSSSSRNSSSSDDGDRSCRQGTADSTAAMEES